MELRIKKINSLNIRIIVFKYIKKLIDKLIREIN